MGRGGISGAGLVAAVAKADVENTDSTRGFVKDVKRIIIKVGTAVVTGPNGRLAMGRLGALCEQVKQLNFEGYEVILVTSGAVGVGRQRLKYRKLVNSSFADLQNPQMDMDGKACAAVGQSVLMAIYDTLFSQLDVTSSQLLVTDRDFMDPSFGNQLRETVNSLLDLKVIPVFNENDAISTRRQPYEDSSGIFWDNDSLARLLAQELKADLLIMLSDVEGLYSGPPSDPQSKIIHTYVHEQHGKLISFGEKSRVGRGGMQAKVAAAFTASSKGIPVVIASGFAIDSIIKVMRGEKIGTLFHREANQWGCSKEATAREMAVAARDCSRHLQKLSSEERKKILLDIADALEANEDLITSENQADLDLAQDIGYDKSLVARMTIKPGKIKSLAGSIREIADMEDPISHTLKRTEVAKDLVFEKTYCPLGVLLIIFESRPDALVQIASLAIRSGNGLLLKGGKEAMRSNTILHKVITGAIPDVVGKKLIGLVKNKDEIADLLKLDDVIDLVIPRGSNKLVSQIKAATKIPVLGHADGICHVYIDKSADMDMAKRIVLDAKVDYPAACNAMETLLVHKDLNRTEGLDDLLVELEKEGVVIYGGPVAHDTLKLPKVDSFHHEYNSMACTLEFVDDVQSAIDHINRYGSAHTDCIITTDGKAAETFLQQVDSAAVFHNASTRFCDGARFGLGAEVGISTGRIHARGPVGVDGLLTTRCILRGSGQVVNGDKGVVYTHRELPLQ
ncbi:delta-1-pyrroline-5-carboxylate synthase 2 [Oryza glaberrima]|uniref:Delta-1-pyrroline-5-carboxylate synthase n=1 Tax=Oryza glaberrima TaxID=4538 RepID=I1NTB9_ORYGL|nr:delta-1-pyrroline-5-carboxylate synthase 2 [Oryza glaberrima]